MIARYVGFHNKTPEELIEVVRRDRDEAAKMLDRYSVNIDIPESRKMNDVAAVHAFHKANYQDLASRAGYSKVEYVKVKDTVCPSQEELREIERYADLRDKAVINVISSGGFREETASLLVWGDLRELWMWNGKTPVYVKVEANRLKGKGKRSYKGVEQHTFMTAYACEVLLKYAEWYRARRELTDDAPLFIATTAHAGKPAVTALNPGSFHGIVKNASGGRFTPHDLRRYAQTQLEEARLPSNWIKKMQGKKLKGEEDPYSRPKIEKLREAFAHAESHITLAEPKAMDEKELRIQVLIDTAIAQGLDPEKAQSLRMIFKQRNIAPEEAAEMIKEEMQKERNRGEQQIVDVDELANHLSHEWRFVASLGNGKCVVEKL